MTNYEKNGNNGLKNKDEPTAWTIDTLQHFS